MDNNDKDIIKFEDLFKDEIERKKVRQEEPINKQHYWFAILSYLLIMFIGAFIISIIAMQFEPVQKTYSEDERLFFNVKQEIGAIALIDQFMMDLYLEDYENYVTVIGQYSSYFVIVNTQNKNVENFLLVPITIDEEETWTIDLVLFEEIFFDGIHQKWSSSNISIKIFATQGQNIIGISEDANIIIGSRTTISSFGLAIINFLVYLLLLPLVLYFLKKPLIRDFIDFKLNFSSYIVPLIVGYLYLIAGNVISNVITNFLSKIFAIEPQTAINQMIIIDALKSNGAVFMVIGAVVFGPIVEELIFRKALFGIITNDKIALAVSTIIFGMIHLTSETSIIDALVNGVPYFVMGFIFGFIYLQTKKNIMIVTIVHMVSNLISVLAIIFFA
jgi:membrane protease YdiL (CAAX protease family)